MINKQIKREQVVSITCNETCTQDGDAVLAIVYRRHQDPSMTSLDGLQYHLVASVKDWGVQYETVLQPIID